MNEGSVYLKFKTYLLKLHWITGNQGKPSLMFLMKISLLLSEIVLRLRWVDCFFFLKSPDFPLSFYLLGDLLWGSVAPLKIEPFREQQARSYRYKRNFDTYIIFIQWCFSKFSFEKNQKNLNEKPSEIDVWWILIRFDKIRANYSAKS